MATTNVQPLRSMRSRMEYTRLGAGAKRRAHLEAGTDRIVDRAGDFESRDDFVEYCEAIVAGSRRRVEGFEVRVSFDDIELSPNRPDDIAVAVGHGYRLAKAIAPNSPCDVTAHTDGEGGKLHVHVEIANIDEATGLALAHGMNHRRISLLSDEICKDEGLPVTGAKAEFWREKRGKANDFERELGDRVYLARSRSHDVASFRKELCRLGVELKETRKAAADGSVSVGWSYWMRYPPKGPGRLRRRAASRLAGEFSKEDIEARFEDCSFGAEKTSPSFPTPSAPVDSEEEIEGYGVSADMVAMAAGDILAERKRQLISAGSDGKNDDVLKISERAVRNPEGAAQKLRAEVERARSEFMVSKALEQQARSCPTVWVLASKVFSVIARSSADPFSRMASAYLREWAWERNRQVRLMRIESAKARTYVARAEMWGAEKRARAAGVAISEYRAEERMRKARRIIERGEQFEYELTRKRQRDRQLGG